MAHAGKAAAHASAAGQEAAREQQAQETPGALEDRVAQAMRSHNLSKRDAEKWVERTDRERAAFVKDHFLKDPTDPRQYDLILNISRWSVMECADLIVDALGRLTSRTR